MWKKVFCKSWWENFKYADRYNYMFLWLKCLLSLTANSLAMCVKWTLGHSPANSPTRWMVFTESIYKTWCIQGLLPELKGWPSLKTMNRIQVSWPSEFWSGETWMEVMEVYPGGPQARHLLWSGKHIASVCCLGVECSLFCVWSRFLSDFMCLLSEETAAYGWYHLQNTDIF